MRGSRSKSKQFVNDGCIIQAMPTSLDDPRVRRVLDDLHTTADRNDPPLLARARGKQGEERAALLGEAFIPVSPDAGRLLYTLARGAASGTFLEFGTSFGISTIYLAAAARDRGASRVITTEMVNAKAERAREHIMAAGLADMVEIRVGDALKTLEDLKRDVSVAFLDGWKELYLPFLRMIEPSLLPGAFVVGDDLNLFPDVLRDYLAYVRDQANGYVSVMLPIGDAMELSVRVK
jgi:predicted O-methyltransferase YrrM